jgi:lipoate-protein ligase A
MILNKLSLNSYTLPDSIVLEPGFDSKYYIWQPNGTYIVLGRANSIESSVIEENALLDNIKIFKRPSGGESVVLSPNMLIFSSKFKKERDKRPGDYFAAINSALIKEFTSLGINGLYSKGISDISIHNKKIMGSSMYLNGSTLFYHAVLNVCEDVNLLSRYLKHPNREPDYRIGRSHTEFVTSIHKEGYFLDILNIKEAVKQAFNALHN